MTIENNVLTADEGKVLTNGSTYGTQVYLGIHDSPNNWYEINEDEIPTDDEPSTDNSELAEAVRILLDL